MERERERYYKYARRTSRSGAAARARPRRAVAGVPGAASLTVNLRTTIQDFRGFDSSRILGLEGGILRPRLRPVRFPYKPCRRRKPHVWWRSSCSPITVWRLLYR